MVFNSAFKGLKLLKTPERTFKQFKWPRPQCVKKCQLVLLGSCQLENKICFTWRTEKCMANTSTVRFSL